MAEAEAVAAAAAAYQALTADAKFRMTEAEAVPAAAAQAEARTAICARRGGAGRCGGAPRLGKAAVAAAANFRMTRGSQPLPSPCPYSCPSCTMPPCLCRSLARLL